MISTYLNWGWVSVLFSIVLPVLFILNFLMAFYGFTQRKYGYSISILIFLLLFNVFYKFSPFTTIENKESLSILTFNTKGFSANLKDKTISSNIMKFLDSVQADIIVLQESNYPIIRKIKNYNYNFSDLRLKKKKSLLTIYSKFPIINTGYTDFPDTKNNGIFADILIKNDTVRLYNLHLQSHQLSENLIEQNPFKKLNNTLNQQLNQAIIVKKSMNSTSNKIIVSGDFNATQYSEPYKILKEDLNDSFIERGQGLGITYKLKSYPLRIDFVLMDYQIEIITHKNFKLNLSDHEPVLVTFKL
ncbi:endonuclease/exonuclease/phosphatase family protein [Formosa sp. PL04]|uniref:endonuclease/exonuclease/phosphatase family protein n=1 Tax=Formosa sp. PL04 TaxID=3081755 RepID=UPI0029823F49|nr:endonuclease/exonuclease/phosphatase family protein [Formosa sp. PL04]MDW5289371.1 endonuclease/exonuclease/phosphatase family protein [Formosa sp. PL04]